MEYGYRPSPCRPIARGLLSLLRNSTSQFHAFSVSKVLQRKIIATAKVVDDMVCLRLNSTGAVYS